MATKLSTLLSRLDGFSLLDLLGHPGRLTATIFVIAELAGNRIEARLLKRVVRRRMRRLARSSD